MTYIYLLIFKCIDFSLEKYLGLSFEKSNQSVPCPKKSKPNPKLMRIRNI